MLSVLAACLVLGMDPDMAAAIVKQESGEQITAFNVNGADGPKTFGDLEKSIALSEHFVNQGHTVDVGLMGINSINIEKMNQTIENAFDPCINIKMGEIIYTDNLKRAHRVGHQGDEAIKVALSLYNTGDMSRGFRNGYVDAVWKKYKGNSSDYEARISPMRVEWDTSSNWPIVD